jgi:hypothetical protein
MTQDNHKQIASPSLYSHCQREDPRHFRQLSASLQRNKGIYPSLKEGITLSMVENRKLGLGEMIGDCLLILRF